MILFPPTGGGSHSQPEVTQGGKGVAFLGTVLGGPFLGDYFWRGLFLEGDCFSRRPVFRRGTVFGASTFGGECFWGEFSWFCVY